MWKPRKSWSRSPARAGRTPRERSVINCGDAFRPATIGSSLDIIAQCPRFEIGTVCRPTGGLRGFFLRRFPPRFSDHDRCGRPEVENHGRGGAYRRRYVPWVRLRHLENVSGLCGICDTSLCVRADSGDDRIWIPRSVYQSIHCAIVRKRYSGNLLSSKSQIRNRSRINPGLSYRNRSQPSTAIFFARDPAQTRFRGRIVVAN